MPARGKAGQCRTLERSCDKAGIERRHNHFDQTGFGPLASLLVVGDEPASTPPRVSLSDQIVPARPNASSATELLAQGRIRFERLGSVIALSECDDQCLFHHKAVLRIEIETAKRTVSAWSEPAEPVVALRLERSSVILTHADSEAPDRKLRSRQLPQPVYLR